MNAYYFFLYLMTSTSKAEAQIFLKAMSTKQVVSHPGRKLTLDSKCGQPRRGHCGIDVWHMA